MTVPPIDKYLLNLTGEYRVASELCRRGMFATITYGNKKGADIYAIGPHRKTAIVEVKASNTSRFVTGFYQKYADEMADHPDFWVLCSFRDADEDFYVLSHAEMAVAQARRNQGDALSWVENAHKVRSGVDNVLARDLQEYRSAWAKITEWCESDVGSIDPVVRKNDADS